VDSVEVPYDKKRTFPCREEIHQEVDAVSGRWDRFDPSTTLLHLRGESVGDYDQRISISRGGLNLNEPL
jgi:hypothetical protein